MQEAYRAKSIANKTQGMQQQAVAHQKEAKIDIPVALLLALFPFGWQMLDLPNAPLVGALSWAICLFLVARIVWIIAESCPGNWRLAISLSIPTIAVALLWIPVYDRINRPKEAPPISTSESPVIEELKSINEFIGGKDEYNLQEMFGYTELIEINTHMVADKLSFYKTHSANDHFRTEPYTEAGNEMQIDARFGKVTRPEGLIHYDPFPNAVGIIILPLMHSESKKRLVAYLHSGTLPMPVLGRLKEFNAAVDGNLTVLFDVLNQAVKEHPEYFFRLEAVPLITTRWHDRLTLLEPKAYAVTQTIREFLKI